jgi:hypothetical protein
MRKQIQGRKTAVNGRVISDIRSDLSDQETEGCYAMPYKIYGVHTITSLLITLHMSHSVFDKCVLISKALAIRKLSYSKWNGVL